MRLRSFLLLSAFLTLSIPGAWAQAQSHPAPQSALSGAPLGALAGEGARQTTLSGPGASLESAHVFAEVSEGWLRTRSAGVSSRDCPRLMALLLDFERQPRFLPGVERSRILSRESNGTSWHLTVEQKIRVDVGWVSLTRVSRRQVEASLEGPPWRIRSREVEPGELAKLQAESLTELIPQGQGCLLRHSGQARIPGWMPESLAVSSAESNARRFLLALLAEAAMPDRSDRETLAPSTSAEPSKGSERSEPHR